MHLPSAIEKLLHPIHKRPGEQKAADKPAAAKPAEVKTADTPAAAAAPKAVEAKPVLYVFGGAVWPSAPWLATYTLGYGDKIEIKQLNLIEGANFDPEFVRLNPEAILPTLVVDGKAVTTDTTSTVKYLIANAPTPAGKASGTDLVQKLHEDAVDPNFALLSARNEEELKGKGDSIPGLFIRNRQAALEKYAPTAPDLEAFYKGKLEANGFLNTVYGPNAPVEVKEMWFAKSKGAWEAIRAFILTDIPAALPESGGYIGGPTPGEDDFHLAAWLARLGAVTGGTPAADGVLAIKKELGGAEVPQKIVTYWKLWSETEAWKQVYSAGLH